jgi:hypothetical protein
MSCRSVLSVLVLALTLSACARTGGVDGDVYATMKSGDVKRGADVEVVIVRPTPDYDKEWKGLVVAFRTELEAASEAVKKAEEEESAQSTETDKSTATIKSLHALSTDALKRRHDVLTRQIKAMERTNDTKVALISVRADYHAKAVALLQKGKIAAVRTDVNGHYSKDELEPGQYYLYAAHRIFDNSITWYVPLDVRRGKQTKLDLSGSNAGWLFDNP